MMGKFPLSIIPFASNAWNERLETVASIPVDVMKIKQEEKISSVVNRLCQNPSTFSCQTTPDIIASVLI